MIVAFRGTDRALSLDPSELRRLQAVAHGQLRRRACTGIALRVQFVQSATTTSIAGMSDDAMSTAHT